MSDSDDFAVARLRPRETDTVPVEIPRDTLAMIGEVAAEKDMSVEVVAGDHQRHALGLAGQQQVAEQAAFVGVEALLRFYIGQGLRQDVSRRYADRLIKNTERVLAEHIESEDERTEMLREIRGVRAA